MRSAVLFVFLALWAGSKAEDDADSGPEEQDLDESGERAGPSVTQIFKHPYTATLSKNNTYVCSATILNTYWLLTLTKCFDPEVTSAQGLKNAQNFLIRVGSSYNSKGGALYKIKTLAHNIEIKVTAVRLETPVVFSARVKPVQLPSPDEDVALGYLASLVAWTPNGHIRLVNVPVLDSSICDYDTKLMAGLYICVGAVQDANKQFCRQDNGGPIIQNDTLIGITSFHHTCAIYTKTHAFPKVSSFANWIDSVIWDEVTKPTTQPQKPKSTTTTTTIKPTNASDTTDGYFVDPRRFMLTLPFDPINVPLEPAEDNSVIPRMSLYESYLHNMAKKKTSTTEDPSFDEKKKMEWFKKYGQAMMRMPSAMFRQKYDQYEYN